MRNKLNPCGPISTSKRPREPELEFDHYSSHNQMVEGDEPVGTSSDRNLDQHRPIKRQRLSGGPTEKVSIPATAFIRQIENKPQRRRRGPPTKAEKRTPGFYDDALTCQSCGHGYKKDGGERGAALHKCKVKQAMKTSTPDCFFCGTHLPCESGLTGVVAHVLICIAIRRLKARKNRDGCSLLESGLTQANISKFQFPDRRPEQPSESLDQPTEMIKYLLPIEKPQGTVS